MKSTYWLLLALGLLAGVSCAASEPAQDGGAEAAEGAAAAGDGALLATDEQKTLYTVGLALSQRLSGFGLDEEDLKRIHAGLSDGVLGNDPQVDPAAWANQIDPMLNARRTALAEKQKADGAAYVAEQAALEGAKTLESGAIYFAGEPGDGAQPAKTDRVKIHYEGTLIDGKVFDSSRKGGQPAEFSLNGVIPCFSQGVQQMAVGGTARLVCPASTAYGDNPPPGIPPGATLIFEVELLEILAAPAPATDEGGEDPIP